MPVLDKIKVSLPLVGLAPPQLPAPAQVEAFDEDQDKVTEFPLTIEFSLDVKEFITGGV